MTIATGLREEIAALENLPKTMQRVMAAEVLLRNVAKILVVLLEEAAEKTALQDGDFVPSLVFTGDDLKEHH